jgi:dynein light intermediate chain 1
VTAPLFYHYLNVKNIEDPQSDRLTTLHVWGCEEQKLQDLLSFALKPEMLPNTVVAIVLDWERPWRFLQDLRDWLDIWHDKLSRVISSLSLSEQDGMVDKVQKYLQGYKEPGEAEDSLASELPLPEGVLSVNMGVPIIVVCNKADLIWQVDKNREACEKTLDFVLRSLRQFCLTYGAALVYTSTTDNVNIDTFYEYVLHRIYGFRSSRRAQVIERNDIFVPAGWDSPNLVR